MCWYGYCLAGTQVNSKTRKGLNALHFAVQNGACASLVALLAPCPSNSEMDAKLMHSSESYATEICIGSTDDVITLASVEWRVFYFRPDARWAVMHTEVPVILRCTLLNVTQLRYLLHLYEALREFFLVKLLAHLLRYNLTIHATSHTQPPCQLCDRGHRLRQHLLFGFGSCLRSSRNGGPATETQGRPASSQQKGRRPSVYGQG